MKPPTLRLCLRLGMAITMAAAAASLTGCAGDRYNRSTGEYIDDTAVVSRVKDILKNNPDYKYDGVQVAAFKGSVQLSGFVDNLWLKYNASSLALKAEGVRNVENNITVKPAAQRSAGEFIDDKSLSARVKSSLADNPGYKFDEVTVTALKGTVQLSGFVNTGDQKAQAGDIAKKVEGVKDLVNNITVKDKM